eukprot:2530705-Pleurochrysis_carterae.AAC.1
MAAWKTNAALKRERDRFESKVRGAARKAARSSFVVSQASGWHREASHCSSAQAQLTGVMTSCRSAKQSWDAEIDLRRKAEKESAELRAELTKLKVQLRAAEGAGTRLEHLRFDLVAANKKLVAAEAASKELRREKVALMADVAEVQALHETAQEQLAEYADKLSQLEKELHHLQSQHAEL